jgi:hypothetical protein
MKNKLLNSWIFAAISWTPTLARMPIANFGVALSGLFW